MIKNLILKIVGSTLIIFYIYLRFIHERLPRSLDFWTIHDEYYCTNYGIIFIVLFSIIFYIMLLFKQIVLSLELKIPNKFTGSKISKLLNKMVTFIKDSLFSVYALIYEQTPSAYKRLKQFCLFTYRLFAYKEQYIVIFELFILALILSCFFYDIFVLFELHYFYISLVLYCISPFIKLWLYLIEDWVHNMDEITKTLKVKHTFLPDGRDHFVFTVEGNFDKETKEVILVEDSKEYLSMVPLRGFLDSYKVYENQYKPKCLLVLYSLYIIGWIYILIINIS